MKNRDHPKKIGAVHLKELHIIQPGLQSLRLTRVRARSRTNSQTQAYVEPSKHPRVAAEKRRVASKTEISAKRPYAASAGDIATRREKALLVSEARFKRLLESVTSYVYTVTVEDGHAVSTIHHAGCEGVTGFLPADFDANPYLWYQLVHPDDRPKVIEMANEILSGTRNLSLVHRIRHKDGSIRWVRNLLVPHFDENDMLLSYDGIINDITERKEIEESLQSSERNLRLITENTHDMIFSMDLDGRLLTGNSSFKKMIADLSGGQEINSGDIVPLDGLSDRLHSQWWCNFERAIAGERIEVMLPIQLCDGAHEMECVFNPIATAGGQIGGAAVFLHDVTERIHAQKAVSTIVQCMAKTTGLESLSVMAENLEKCLEADGVVIGEFLDHGSGITIRAASLGGRAVSNTPYTIGAFQCMRIAEEPLCFHPKHGPWVFPEEAGPPILGMGSHLGVPIRNSQGTTIGILCAIARHPFKATPACIEIMEVMASKAGAEIERVRNEKILRNLCDQKEIMLREIHHRVKNNLQIISSLIQLQSGQERDENAASAIMAIRDRIQSMAFIHEALYDAIAMDTIGFSGYCDKLCHYLSEAYCPLDGRIRINNRVNELDLGLDQAVLCGLIINELVTNALKYAFPGQRHGTITVEFGPLDAETMKLRITDDGVGLPAGFLPEKAKTLGIVLVSCLSQQLGGNLQMECGNGTSFVVQFPISRPNRSSLGK
jgi:PAS domain S-box-containing protein